jgi:peptidyl-prolyl cis-trans isomerase B (cyclophilin B)
MRHLAAARAVAGIAALTFAAIGCGSSSSGGSQAVTQPTSSESATAAPNKNGCTPAPAVTGDPQDNKYSHEPPLTIAHAAYTARVVTNCGTIMVSLDGKHAPHTVNSFAFLAKQGYFTDTPCHRLTTSGIYVLQCGDPTGTGTGGPGYTIPDENLAHATYPAGTVAMANTGQPHTGGSQFFFVYANTNLPPQYTPFGRITAGLDVLKKVAAAGSTPPGDGKPNQPVVIESFGVTKG